MLFIYIESIEQALPLPNELRGRKRREILVLGTLEFVGRKTWIGNPVSADARPGPHDYSDSIKRAFGASKV